MLTQAPLWMTKINKSGACIEDSSRMWGKVEEPLLLVLNGQTSQLWVQHSWLLLEKLKHTFHFKSLVYWKGQRRFEVKGNGSGEVECFKGGVVIEN